MVNIIRKKYKYLKIRLFFKIRLLGLNLKMFWSMTLPCVRMLHIYISLKPSHNRLLMMKCYDVIYDVNERLFNSVDTFFVV